LTLAELLFDLEAVRRVLADFEGVLGVIEVEEIDVEYVLLLQTFD
jgi:hypothetical protein